MNRRMNTGCKEKENFINNQQPIVNSSREDIIFPAALLTDRQSKLQNTFTTKNINTICKKKFVMLIQIYLNYFLRG